MSDHLLKENRLKQTEIDEACNAVMQRGERISTTTIHKELGERGSFSTIQKMMKDWQARNPEQSDRVENLPLKADIPETLKGAGENALKAFWYTARELAHNELEVQRESLKKAEEDINLKIEELQEFSDNQTNTIEVLREQLEQMTAERIEREAENTKIRADFDTRIKASEEQAKGLNTQLTRLQTTLDAQIEKVSEAKAERTEALNAEKVAIEKAAALTGKLELVLSENKELKKKPEEPKTTETTKTPPVRKTTAPKTKTPPAKE